MFCIFHTNSMHLFSWNLTSRKIISSLPYTGNTHYNDVIISAMASEISSLPIAYSTVYSGTDQRKYQSSTSLAFVRGNHCSPVDSPHKGPVTPSCMTEKPELHEQQWLGYTEYCFAYTDCINSWAPRRCSGNFKSVISINMCQIKSSQVNIVKSLSGECHRMHLMRSQW